MSTYALKKPLDESTHATLRELFEAAEAMGVQVCLIGAQARILWLTHIHGLEAARATRDTDFAVQIDDWEQFAALSAHLIDHHGWRKDLKQSQRFFSATDQMVDLVPCGGVAVGDEISWPPDHAHRMDVRGFELTMSEGVHIDVGDGCQVTIAPLHVLALLKVISWWDRGTAAEKDAVDLIALLRSYADAEAHDLLTLDEHLDLYELEDDHEQRGARLVGRLIAAAAETATLDLARRVLEEGIDESGSMKLVSQAAEALTGDIDTRTEAAYGLLTALGRGLNERSA
ncbi:MAG: hypothetical protein V2J02_14620 [Pseudomonadales bacterium]|jgi:predicted nucleotidyltransferase|nr:hypothetical protein [Pseudomonadales bacterium]